MKLKKILSVLSAVALATVPLAGCGGVEERKGDMNSAYNIPQDNCRTYYEIFVRSFADSDGDGIGDIQGIIENLDYLNDGDDKTDTDLGINGIWLMPIQESPSYHGYDSIDYMSIESDYGTMADFEELIDECDKRGIWVQIDLVLNHSSNQHPWFLSAINEAQSGRVTPETSEYMRRYNFALKDEVGNDPNYKTVPSSDYCYLAYFDSSQPDLNLDDEDVRNHIEDMVDFWFSKGVRSFRLDAVPYAYGANASDAGTQNIEFWTWFNDLCDETGKKYFEEEGDGIERYGYNVGEVWAGSTVIDKYFTTGMSAFNYSLGSYSSDKPSSFIGIVKTAHGEGSADKGAAGLVKTVADMQAKYDSDALLSNFISNHDNDRAAGFLSNDATQIKETAGLYLLMPGNPYIYYGDEIGAAGNGDDPSRRMAFNWGDRDHYEINNPPGVGYTGGQPLGSVADQINDSTSILSYYREAIKLRNRFPEIGRGVMTPYAVNASGKLQLDSEIREENNIIATGNLVSKVNELNRTVAAYELNWNGSSVVIVQNLGDKSVTLDASVFSSYKLVGQLKANGGTVSFKTDNKLTLSAGTVAVLKK